MAKKSMNERAYNGLGNLLRLLPTGTVFMYQFLSPVLSNYGKCYPINKYLMGGLLVICGFNCAFATFTDSYVDDEGNTHYGIATSKGLWPCPNNNNNKQLDFSMYKLKIGDFVHAALSLFVFAVVAGLDKNTVDCYAPELEVNRKTMLVVVPPVVGAFVSGVFVLFPCKRHGIGYPSENTGLVISAP